MAGTGTDTQIVDRFLTGLVPRSSRINRFDLATLCLEIVASSDGCRGAAEAAIAAGGFTGSERMSLCGHGQRFTTTSQVLWWHDVFVSHVREDAGYHAMLSAHADLLLAHRHADVLAYLLEPDRGPGGGNLESVAAVVAHTDQPDPLVARWGEWIRAGRFDGCCGPGDASAALLTKCLDHGLEARPDLLAPLLDEAIVRWRWQLGHDDAEVRLRGARNLVQVLEAEPAFARRVHAEVLRAVEPSRVPEWAGLQRAFTALLYARDAGGDRARRMFEDAYRDVLLRAGDAWGLASA